MQKGFTVIEKLIVVVILAVGVGVVAMSSKACGGAGDMEETEAQARTFSDKLGYKVVGVSCVSHDSDGDGYISCTVRHEPSSGVYKEMAIECAGGLAGFFKKGCRQVKLNLHRQQ